jgi:hypothetical protein
MVSTFEDKVEKYKHRSGIVNQKHPQTAMASDFDNRSLQACAAATPGHVNASW